MDTHAGGANCGTHEERTSARSPHQPFQSRKGPSSTNSSQEKTPKQFKRVKMQLALQNSPRLPNKAENTPALDYTLNIMYIRVLHSKTYRQITPLIYTPERALQTKQGSPEPAGTAQQEHTRPSSVYHLPASPPPRNTKTAATKTAAVANPISTYAFPHPPFSPI